MLRRSSIAGNGPNLVVAAPGEKGFDDLIKDSRPQEAKFGALSSWQFPQIVAGPDELVALANDYPGAGVLETKAPFDRPGDFDAGLGIVSRQMRDGRNDDERLAVRLALNGECNNAGTVLASRTD